LKSVRELMGHDFWSYGVESNRKTLEFFLHHHHSQGLSPQLMKVEEMFHPSVYETFKL
jgi:4,5-dihydroxyphthalate decarboxylase